MDSVKSKKFTDTRERRASTSSASSSDERPPKNSSAAQSSTRPRPTTAPAQQRPLPGSGIATAVPLKRLQETTRYNLNRQILENNANARRYFASSPAPSSNLSSAAYSRFSTPQTDFFPLYVPAQRPRKLAKVSWSDNDETDDDADGDTDEGPINESAAKPVISGVKPMVVGAGECVVLDSSIYEHLKVKPFPEDRDALIDLIVNGLFISCIFPSIEEQGGRILCNAAHSLRQNGTWQTTEVCGRKLTGEENYHRHIRERHLNIYRGDPVLNWLQRHGSTVTMRPQPNRIHVVEGARPKSKPVKRNEARKSTTGNGKEVEP